MIVRSGLAANVLVELTSGQPDGDEIAWNIYDEDGTQLDTGTLAVPAASLSALIPLSAAVNTLAVGELYAVHDVEWTYTVSGLIINGETRYSVEARLPIGIAPEGVRAKLGVHTVDLPDDQMQLAKAYASLRKQLGEAEFDAAAATAGLTGMRLRDGVEALAAMWLIPTMKVRVALSEDSGTNAFKRQEIDWDRIAAHLQALVDAAISEVDDTYDPGSAFGPLFIIASPESDPITGQSG